jgi:hypothetical protein
MFWYVEPTLAQSIAHGLVGLIVGCAFVLGRHAGQAIGQRLFGQRR